MDRTFHDINYPMFHTQKKQESEKKKRVTGVDDSTPLEKKEESEIRLISAEWEPGPKGFKYNEQCLIKVKAEFLKKTIRTRIRGKLYGIYDDKEVDLSHEISGFINKETGIAKMNIKYLFFMDEHYDAWCDDMTTPCKYFIKDIYHTCGENKIDSEILEMPANDSSKVRFRFDINPNDEEYQDDTFTLYSTDDLNSYNQTLTVKDDKVTDDNCIDLEFSDLVPDLSYTLKVNPGAQGDEYFLIEKLSYVFKGTEP